jgi:hypothetical protein
MPEDLNPLTSVVRTSHDTGPYEVQDLSIFWLETVYRTYE